MDNAAGMTPAKHILETDGGLALRHARTLLDSFGGSGDPRPIGDHPALAWRRSGLLELTGREDGPGVICPVPLTAAADGALAALRALAPSADLPHNGATLLGERGRLMGLQRNGRTSANKSCRLFATLNGYVALNLARPDDWELVPALFMHEASSWSEIEHLAEGWDSTALVARGRLLGLAIATSTAVPAAKPFVMQRHGIPSTPAGRTPLVLDMSSLWAGPLAASLLRSAGAQVIKVESTQRPDGARFGHPGFFHLLNAGKQHATFDFRNEGDLVRLRHLVDRADILIEGSRPRALRQLGLQANAFAARGGTWISITAHGRTGEAADHIGFGDDAAIAGGLGSAMENAWGEPMFVGDAIADPLTGITAAFAGWAAWLAGGGSVIALSLADVIANACAMRPLDNLGPQAWQRMSEADGAPLYELRSNSSG